VQQRQSAHSRLENLAIDELHALRRLRTRRLQMLMTGAAAAALTLFAAGCPAPADLDNPEAFDAPAPTGGMATAGSPTGGGGGGSTPSPSCETACMTTVLNGCVICHSTASMLGKLDLSGAYTARLKDQPAKHDMPGAGPCPTGDKLIDSANASNSWFLKKVSSEHGSCGTEMPPGGGLKGPDLTCVQTYVACVAGGTPAGGGSGGTGGT
jgi:hypothetical protein